ncbi:MAG: hypothetical protein WCQ69_01230 [Bacteroidales bacterium]|jgi:hypothetical protein|nr:hypothetical protein [Bacteroidales bacterium]MDD2263450.1 hypothetical protein [Bacteroidales bacterium]MDD2830760.1 hypothetical protein [Bacteroidales bacterium]MDD3207959.1 hypothetical protein [Bacteroidales bacterium]MDD3696534.1 hypothetical protein [Bacteroidales bacterium]
MSEKTLHNQHLKDNPFRVPQGYFDQVQTRWAVRNDSPEEIRDVPGGYPVSDGYEYETGGKGGRLVRLLKPQLQLAAAFLLLFGIGYVLLLFTGKNKDTQLETGALSIMSEWSYWGLDHHTISDLVLEDFMDQEGPRDKIDPDVDDLMDYINYPGFDLMNFDLTANNE